MKQNSEGRDGIIRLPSSLERRLWGGFFDGSLFYLMFVKYPQMMDSTKIPYTYGMIIRSKDLYEMSSTPNTNFD